MNKEKEYNVAEVTQKKVKEPEVMEMFNIDHITLPLKNDGKLHIVGKGGFIGDAEIHYTNGSVDNIAVMRSKFKDGKKVYIRKGHSNAVYLDNNVAEGHVPMGFTYGSKQDDGTVKYKASRHLPVSLWSFLDSYITDNCEALEIVGEIAAPQKDLSKFEGKDGKAGKAAE